jgi:2-iminoacetate synthase ThiH
MGLDLEVLQQKVRRIAAVGLDAAHLRGGEHHHRGLVFGEPGFHSRAIEQVELRAVGGEELVVAGALEGTADRSPGHTAVAGYEDAVGGG